ncbi:helix-turn-helix transcriptional regulator [Streptomyces decoyicus]
MDTPRGTNILSQLDHQQLTFKALAHDPSELGSEIWKITYGTALRYTRAIHVQVPDAKNRKLTRCLAFGGEFGVRCAGWAHEVHAGVRTLSRLFLSETGLPFAQWRTHVRIRAAAQQLVNGESVNVTARAVDYRKTSAFINVFRRPTGQAPGSYSHVDNTPLPTPAQERR